jgi:hypothetical protein
MRINSIVLLFILISCGKGVSDERSDLLIPQYDNQEENLHYRGILRPINNHLSGFLPSGLAEVIIKNEELEAKTLLDDDAKVIHLQSIHLGNRCPEITDDKNSDGHIDINEAILASGEVYIPLDGDLNSANLGKEIYPMGGGYTYTKRASLKRISQDLWSRNLSLQFANKVVLIHGTYKINNLPTTIATNGISPVEKSLPIACGVLRKLEWVRSTRWQER